MSDLGRVSLTVSGAAVFGVLVGAAALRPLVVLALLASALVVGALGTAAWLFIVDGVPLLARGVVSRHRAGMARLRADAMRRHPSAGRMFR